MPLPRWLARFNRIGTNRFFGLFAHRVPPWVVVHHRGRVSGREYQAVVWSFRTADGFVVALTYGSGSDWVQNVRAAGGCVVERRGKQFAVTGARVVVGDEGRRLAPWVLRPALRVLLVKDFLVLSIGE